MTTVASIGNHMSHFGQRLFELGQTALSKTDSKTAGKALVVLGFITMFTATINSLSNVSEKEPAKAVRSGVIAVGGYDLMQVGLAMAAPSPLSKVGLSNTLANTILFKHVAKLFA